MPAPPPESEPAMIRTRPRTLFRRCGPRDAVAHQTGPAVCGRDYLAADRVHDHGDQLLVVSLGHDSDHRLGSRSADYQAASGAKPGLAVFDRLRDRQLLEGFSITKPHAAQQLRHRGEQIADLARPPAGLDNGSQDLECRNQSISGCRIIGEDDVTGLLTTKVAAERAHFLDHVAISDRGAMQRDLLVS